MKANDKQIEQRILERTAEIIFDRGIRGWSMDQLAADVGLAKNTLYKIINSKEELIERVIIGYIRSVQTRMVEIINQERDYIIALEKITSEFPTLLNSLYTGSMQEIFLEYPSIEKRVRAHQDEMTIRIITFLKTGIDKGVLRSDAKPEFFFEILQALILHFIKTGTKGAELADKLRLAFNFLIKGIKN
ncbi:MAG: TetR/AcrR family transcriptional regulator [Bacillota bacterium]